MVEKAEGVGGAWNERMRLIRLRRKKEQPRFLQELRIVPRWLIGTSITLWVIACLVGIAVMLSMPDARPAEIHDNPAAASLMIFGIITGVSAVTTALLMMLGYVYRDAKRRDMNPVLWTLLVAVLVPSSVLIGFVIYLLVRDPLPYPCPRCSTPVGPRFNFCPNCKNDLHPSCPNCKQEIAETDKFCPNCGNELGRAPATAPQISPAGA